MDKIEKKSKIGPTSWLRRAGVLLAMVAVIAGGALLAGCGGGGSSSPGISRQDIQEAREKLENGEGPSQEEIEKASAKAKERMENGELPGQQEIEEISKRGEEIEQEAMEGLEGGNGNGVDEQKLKQAEKEAEAFAEEVGE